MQPHALALHHVDLDLRELILGALRVLVDHDQVCFVSSHAVAHAVSAFLPAFLHACRAFLQGTRHLEHLSFGVLLKLLYVCLDASKVQVSGGDAAVFSYTATRLSRSLPIGPLLCSLVLHFLLQGRGHAAAEERARKSARGALHTRGRHMRVAHSACGALAAAGTCRAVAGVQGALDCFRHALPLLSTTLSCRRVHVRHTATWRASKRERQRQRETKREGERGERGARVRKQV